MVVWEGRKGSGSWECVNAVGRCRTLHLALAELHEACVGPILELVQSLWMACLPFGKSTAPHSAWCHLQAHQGCT